MDWKKENFTLTRGIRKDSKWTFLNNEFKEKGETMLEKVKQFFRRRSAKTEPSVDILPRNRFADLDFERVLKSGTRDRVDEVGHCVEDGEITLFDFSIDFAEFEFIGAFKIEEEDQFQQLLARLNSIDNAIQSCLESEMQQPIPQFAKDLGYTQKRWEKTFYFHPWILSFEENPPNLRYVADYVNDELPFILLKNMVDGRHTGMQSVKR